MNTPDSFDYTENSPLPEESGQFMVADEPTLELSVLIENLISFSSYLNQMYLQSHLIHLNVEGPLFLPVHEFLKKQYSAHIEQFDSIAEYVRSMDYLMPMCAKGLLQTFKGFKHVKSYDTREMLTIYVKNLETAGMEAKNLAKMSECAGAVDVANYLQELVGDMFKAAWFVKATLRG